MSLFWLKIVMCELSLLCSDMAEKGIQEVSAKKRILNSRVTEVGVMLSGRCDQEEQAVWTRVCLSPVIYSAFFFH